MCKKPIQIPNPNYHSDKPYAYLKDTVHKYLNVPCGHCEECIAVTQMYLVQRIQMEARKNHIFMCTLTYQDSMIPSIVVGDYEIRYASIKDFQNYVKRLRRENVFPRPFRYLAVSERGSKRSRPHFHILWLLPKYEGDTFYDCLNLEYDLYDICLKYWQRNVGTRRKPEYKDLCRFVRVYTHRGWTSTYDLHYVLPSKTAHGVSDAAFYVCKYVLKRSPQSNEEKLRSALKLNYPEQYDQLWSLVRSRLMVSRDFGLYKDPDIRSYIRECIDHSDPSLGYPQYFDEDGRSFPLAPFYWKQPTRVLSRSPYGDPLEVIDPVFTVMDAHDFYFNHSEDLSLENFLLDVPDIVRKERNFKKISTLFNDYDLYNDFND